MNNFLEKMDARAAAQKGLSLMDSIRIIFGIYLTWKGVQFGQEIQDVPVILGRFDFLSIFLLVYLVIVQIAAGVVIALGLITRTALLCVLPILIGAVVYTPRATTLPPFTGELYALICLLLGFTFLLYGSGSFSCDAYYRRHERTGNGK